MSYRVTVVRLAEEPNVGGPSSQQQVLEATIPSLADVEKVISALAETETER